MSPPFARFSISSTGVPGEAAVRIADAVPRGLTGLTGIASSSPPAADAAEYLYLAVKRWKYYFAQGAAASSIAAARQAITADPAAEIGFLLLAEQPGTKRLLGFCFARRVWSGRLVVDFLSVHPRLFDRRTGRPAVGGLGSGLLASIARLVLELDGPGFWGEATLVSHGFYRRMRTMVSPSGDKEPVTDHFRFEGTELHLLAGKILSPETT